MDIPGYTAAQVRCHGTAGARGPGSPPGRFPQVGLGGDLSMARRGLEKMSPFPGSTGGGGFGGRFLGKDDTPVSIIY